MEKEGQDIRRSNWLKGVSAKVTVDEKGIKDSWKKYMEKLMNEENEWDHRISAGVKKRTSWCHCHSLSLAPVNPDWSYQNGSASLVPVYPGCPGKKAVKRM